MRERALSVIILAAGEGTRMQSGTAKVLHEMAGRPLIAHVLHQALALAPDRLSVVIGPSMDDVRDMIAAEAPAARVFIQNQRRGTAHAVLTARPALEETWPAHESDDGDLLVLYADTPLVRNETLGRMGAALAAGAHVVVLGFEAGDPAGYGRLILTEAGSSGAADATLLAIREEKDASVGEHAIRLCNSGVIGFRTTHLLPLLDAIDNDNAAGEFYLTDAVAGARKCGLACTAILCPEEEVLGINSRAQLAAAEAIFQARARTRAMERGATLVAPETVFFSFDTELGRDVIVEPNVVFGPGVRVASGARIRSFSHLERAEVAETAIIGPYARLRPGARIGPSARVGNFVEIKNSVLAEGAKVNHLTYIGDTDIGRDANIGAGTITCNYDGFSKHKTVIGEGAFIGSNSALVAPVTIGKGAYVGSGSVITRSVEADALAVTRAPQRDKAGWAARFRERLARRKAEKDGTE